MFKKAFKTQSTPLSGKDAKTLKKKIQATWEVTKDEESLKLLIPPKSDIVMHKASDLYTVIYAVDGDPMFFEYEKNLFPTVYALWRLPKLLKSFVCHAPVSQFVLTGADLMLPGLVPEMVDYTFKEGEIRSIVSDRNDLPYAVGLTACSGEVARKWKLKGKGLKVYHMVFDTLWEMGASKESLPPGFGRDMVRGLSDPIEQREIPENWEDELAGAGKEETSESSIPNETQAAAPAPAESGSKTEEGAVPTGKEPAEGDENGSGDSDDSEERAKRKAKDKKGKKGKQVIQPPPPAPVQHNSAEMDALLLDCFMKGIHQIKDKDVPILVSEFQLKFMNPNRPAGTTLDVKKSSHKKMSNFIGEMEKCAIVTSREQHGNFHLLSVNKKSETYINYMAAHKGAPEVVITASQAAVLEEKAAKEEADKAEELLAAEGKGRIKDGIKIVRMYRPNKKFQHFFVNDTKEHLYATEDIKEVLRGFIDKNSLDPSKEKRELFKGPKTLINVNHDLAECWTKGEDLPAQCAFDELLIRFQDALQQWYSVTHPGKPSTFKKGKPKSLQLVSETRAGNKAVTRVLNLEDYDFDVHSMCTMMQKRFASAATVPPPMGGGKGSSGFIYEVAIQGNLIKHIAKWLVDELHFPKMYIEICDKARK